MKTRIVSLLSILLVAVMATLIFPEIAPAQSRRQPPPGYGGQQNYGQRQNYGQQYQQQYPQGQGQTQGVRARDVVDLINVIRGGGGGNSQSGNNQGDSNRRGGRNRGGNNQDGNDQGNTTTAPPKKEEPPKKETGPISTGGKEICITQGAGKTNQLRAQAPLSKASGSYLVYQQDDAYRLYVHHWAQRESTMKGGSTSSDWHFVIADKTTGKILWQHKENLTVGANSPFSSPASKQTDKYVPMPSEAGRALRRGEAVVGASVSCNHSSGFTVKDIQNQLKKLGVPYVDQIDFK